jgi:hypothetical protein
MIDFWVPQIRISMAILGLLLMGSGLASSQQFEVGLGVSSLNGSAYNLLVGMADGASDGYVAGEDLYAPPAPPAPSFYSSISYANDSWFSCIIAPDPDPQVFVLSLQFSITDPILIEWDPSLLADGGEYVLRDAVGGGFIEIDMKLQESILIDNIALTNLVLAIVPPPTETFLRSDVNGDGSSNLADSIRLLEHLFLSLPVACFEAGDTNDDASLNLADAIFHLAFLFNGGPAPPAPFPGCGPDPTTDLLGCLETCP